MENIHKEKELGKKVQFYHSKGVLTRVKNNKFPIHTMLFTYKGKDYAVSRAIVDCESNTWLAKLEKSKDGFHYSVRYDPKCSFENALRNAFAQYEAVQPEGVLKEIYEIANNVIYLADNSDYLSALYEICQKIRPDLDPEYVGMKYLDDSNENPDMDDEED